MLQEFPLDMITLADEWLDEANGFLNDVVALPVIGFYISVRQL
jgi:hypothetical protein